MTSSSLQDFARAAAEVLTGERWEVAQAPEHVPSKPGLYAIYGDEMAWSDLSLGPMPGHPFYVGKAEDSLISRDLDGHFAIRPGVRARTGSSTVRRSFAALLREQLNLRAVPRNPAKPGHFSNFGLAGGDDERLNEWMHARLALAIWPAPANMPIPLKDIETEVIKRFTPPINIDKNPGRLQRLRLARAQMAAEASRWPVRDTLRLEITATPHETLVWAPTAQDADDVRRFLAMRGCLVLDPDPWELDFFGRIPEGEREEFDPERTFNVEIGADAFESLTALESAGHKLHWHRWEGDRTGNVWGVEVEAANRGQN